MPSGSFGNYAYAFVHVKSLMQLVAFGGLGAVNFVVAYAVSALYHGLSGAQHNPPFTLSPPQAPARLSHLTPTAPVSRTPSPSSVALGVVVLALFCGGVRTLDSHSQFYQKSIEDWPQGHFTGACIINTTAAEPPSVALDNTRAMASGRSLDVVLWSETMVTVDQGGEEVLTPDSCEGQARDDDGRQAERWLQKGVRRSKCSAHGIAFGR